MNDPGEIPLTNSTTPDTKPCGLISIIPAIGMSSCRGRAEAFARKLSSKLRTLGSQSDEERISPEDEPIINGMSKNTWMPAEDTEIVTELQPVRQETDSFFDFDCELESPGSPVDECEYLRLVETASNTPHNSTAESGYVCESATSSHSSSDSNEHSNNPCNTNEHLNSNEHMSISNFSDFVNILTPNDDPAERNNNEFEQEKIQNVLPDIKLAESMNVLENQDTELDTVESSFTTHTDEDMIEMQNKIIKDLQSYSGYTDTLLPQISDEVDNCAKLQESESIIIHGADNQHYKFLQTTKTGEQVEREEILKIEVTEDFENSWPKEEKISETTTATVAEKTESTEVKDKITNRSVDITDDDEDECRPQRVRRCSSLKTGKTPPGTPGRKKIVRFADVLGLDLADVKTFLDEIPTIPKSAFMDLEIMDSEPPIQLGPRSDKLLMPLFQQPGGLPTFLDIVREKQVSLENASVTDVLNQTITGTVRVRNLDFHKSVYIRYTLDNWRSYADLQANYVQNSCDGFSDKFTFVIFGNSLQIGQRLDLAVRFQCKGQQYWDNNYGTNYCFQCLAAGNPVINTISPYSPSPAASSAVAGLLSPTAGDAWCSSFY